MVMRVVESFGNCPKYIQGAPPPSPAARCALSCLSHLRWDANILSGCCSDGECPLSEVIRLLA